MTTATKTEKKRKNSLTSLPSHTTGVIPALKKGFPFSAFEELRDAMDISNQTLAETVNIPIRTLNRRKKEGRMQPDESDRIYRVARLFSLASRLMGGPENGADWMKTPARALGGKTPLEFSDTEVGGREVEDLLGRIEHGVFS
ncbi:MAG: DUF2384 domain-containing protein [bacterium]|nr:DUF2384 domain-containing protein [bacterium]